MGQSNISREPEQFRDEPVRPTAEEYIETDVYKLHRINAFVLVRRGKTDFRLQPTEKVPKCHPDIDIYIHIEEELQ